MPDVSCPQCHTIFFVKPARLKAQKYPETFCSRACRWTYIKLHGNPLTGTQLPLKKTPEERFSTYVDTMTSPHGCWLWTGGKDKDGYGTFWLREAGQNIRATRFSFALKHGGELPDADLLICHNCPGGDNPSCVNPDHLFLGTTQDNMRDAAKKGRLKTRAFNFIKNSSF